ncbi:hypothetical protein [uncultured Thiodictyon sp.]|jgi:hypothetical protein|uniref:hypothetical protein n=1 Tax=uncultured Thiodictyon sp. TaxID=1846217 RepID=UPI0025F2CFB6|nr:hypothetical protein [uncultured Thiodictyon sp.]
MTDPTHLCLVSAQPTPNLTPLLDPGLAPRRVILLVSPDMSRRAEMSASSAAWRETTPIPSEKHLCPKSC